MDKKEQTRLRVKRYRERQKSVTKESVTPFASVTQQDGYNALYYYLIDDVKRGKLRDICHSLGKYGRDVRFGVGGPTMDVVSEMVEMIECH